MLWHDNDVDVKSSSYVMMLRFCCAILHYALILTLYA